MLRRSRNDRRDKKSFSETPADLLVVGLGNPGTKYEHTRHNIGVEVLNVLAERHDGRMKKGRELALVDELRIGMARVTIAFPQTFMNESGRSVVELARRHGIDDLHKLVVVHDELDIPVGRFKVKLGGGLAGHNGLKSIKQHLKTDDFGRLRIGIGSPHGNQRGPNYVLGRPSQREWEELHVVIEEAADAVELILSQGYDAAMNRYNTAS